MQDLRGIIRFLQALPCIQVFSCPDHIFKQRGIDRYDCSDGIVDEQQTEFLQPFILETFRKMGKKETLYDPYDDR